MKILLPLSLQAWKILLPILFALFGAFSSMGQDRLLPGGHYDLAFNYKIGSGWESYVWDFSEGIALDPYRTIIHADGATQLTIPDSAAYSFLGTPGDPVWVLPEVDNNGVIWLGIGAPLLEPGIFTGGFSNRGRVTFRLVAAAGSGVAAGGEFFMYKSGFPPTVYFSYTDGAVQAGELANIHSNFHAHYNWAFTQPGMYRLTFSLSGTLTTAAGGGYTETFVVYSFLVGENSSDWPLRYAWDSDPVWQWSSWMGWVYTQQAPWVYGPTFGWVHMEPGTPDSFWLWREDLGWCWTTQHYFPWLYVLEQTDWILINL